MLARIRKQLRENRENEQGFTLIELLVVMIIIGILAAIAVPVFLSQRAKARDTSVKADVSTLGKEIAAYWVDNTAAPSVAIVSGRYQVAGVDAGKVSDGVAINGTLTTTAWTSSAWCVALTNPSGSTKIFKYSAQNGLESGACGSATAP